MTKISSGQVMVETCAALTLQVLGATVVLGGCFYVFAVEFVHADAYAVARASMYGAERACRPSRAWPPLKNFRLDFRCPGPGRVEAHLSLPPFVRHELSLRLR